MHSVVLWTSYTFRLCPTIRDSIRRNTVSPGCPNILCHKYGLVVVSFDTLVAKSRLVCAGPAAQAAVQTSSASISEMGFLASIASLYRPSTPALAVARRLCPRRSYSTSSSLSSAMDIWMSFTRTSL